MDPITIISIVCVLIGCAITSATFWISGKKDSKNDGEHTGQIASDLGYLKKGVEDINTKIERSDEKHNVLSEKVGRLDESVKSAHKRLDTLEEKIDKGIEK